jgi:hypothetical protein
MPIVIQTPTLFDIPVGVQPQPVDKLILSCVCFYQLLSLLRLYSSSWDRRYLPSYFKARRKGGTDTTYSRALPLHLEQNVKYALDRVNGRDGYSMKKAISFVR